MYNIMTTEKKNSIEQRKVWLFFFFLKKKGINKILQLVDYKEALKQLQNVQNPVDWGNAHIIGCISKKISLNRYIDEIYGFSCFMN